MSFSERLHFLLEKSQLTHKEIEEKTGIAAAAISHYRKGKSKPGFDGIIALAELFNVTTDWLLLGREPSEYQQHPGHVNRSNEQESDPDLKEWISFFYSVPPDARPLLIGTVRTIVQNSYPASSNPNNAPSTSPNTGDDENAATKSDIA